MLGDDDIALLQRRIDAARHAQPLRAAMQGLTPAERELLLLVAHDQLSVAEASRVLGISSVAGRMRLRRARRAAAAALDHANPPLTDLEGTV